MKSKNLKLVSVLLLIVALALPLMGCTDKKASTKAEATKIIVSEFRGLNYAAIHIAHALGYYAEENLDVEFAVYGDGPIAFQGMHAGDSQFCMLSVEPVFRAQEQGLESSIIIAVDTTRTYGFAGSKDITDPSQLKGKVVFAGAPGSAPFSFIWSILEDSGLDPSQDVTFAQMQYGASIAALEQGTIDASYMDGANKNKFLAVGANILIDGADVETKQRVFGSERFEGSIITATKKYVTDNPETVQAFINATMKGIEWFNSHSNEEVVEILLPYHEGSSKEDLLERLSLVRFAYTADGRISKEGFAAMENFSIKTGVLNDRIGYDSIIDMSFVEKAHK